MRIARLSAVPSCRWIDFCNYKCILEFCQNNQCVNMVLNQCDLILRFLYPLFLTTSCIQLEDPWHLRFV